MNAQSIRSIDAHAHWAPEPYARLLTQLGKQAGTAALRPLMSDLEKRLQWMDERGVQMHVLTLSGSMPWQWASQDSSRSEMNVEQKIITVTSSGRRCRRSPTRLRPRLNW